jgi:glycosyltransferase involved in cell wall biosynthesis
VAPPTLNPAGATPIPPATLPPDFTLLQVTPALEAGGVETLTLDVAQAVAQAGARSLVASRGGSLEAALAHTGASLIRLPLQTKNPASILRNAGRLAEVMRREQVSLAHVRSRAPAFSAILAARAVGAPIIATYHGIYSAGWPLKRWFNGVMTWGDAVIANSNFTRDHILSQHRVSPSKVVVIPEGIDVAAFDPTVVSGERVADVRRSWRIARDEGRAVVLMAARLAGWKGHDVLLEALARMKRRDETLLILAGFSDESPHTDRLRRSIARMGLGGAVRIVGPCADMPAAYLAADVVAAPSVLPESFGRAAAEAGAMRRPVLASRLGAMAETVEDGVTGWLAAPGDPEAWAAALDRALKQDPSSHAAMGDAARARISSLYSLSTMMTSTFDLYGRLARKRR